MMASPRPGAAYDETAKWSCDQMRKKIATFIASKEMTQTAFLKECGGIAPNSYGTTIS